MKTVRTLAAAILIFVVAAASAAQDAPRTPAELCAEAVPAADPESRSFAEPAQVLEAGVDYHAILCTEAGAVYIDLFEAYAPITVNSFVFLAQQGYYNNTTFHRVLENFMAQGGDPTGTGSGGPGYQFRDELLGFLTFDRPGLLAMANAGAGTNGSQFFITTAETSWLNYRHTIFGDVLEGQENVLALRLRDPQANPDFSGAALETVLIITDPASVASDVASVQINTNSEDVLVALGTIEEAGLPEGIAVDAEKSGLKDASAVLAAAPEDARADLEAALDANGFAFRASQVLNNSGCTADFFFTSLRYDLDAFSSASSAQQAQDALGAALEAGGYSRDAEAPRGILVYRRSQATCSDEAGQDLVVLLQRGPYVATVGALISEGVLNQAPIDAIMVDTVAAIFEQFLSDIFRPLPN